MYCITDEQIAYILADIKQREIESEVLQSDLLDHICCIIEECFSEGDDFEKFYEKTIQQFYRHHLKEIEEETIHLLTLKNYHTMKKAMVISGVLSVAALITGAALKVLNLQGAQQLLFAGFASIAFVFLPIFCINRIKESSTNLNKLMLSLGTIIGMLYCICMLWLFMHWRDNNNSWLLLWLVTLSLTFFLFIPLYFFTGIRNPAKKINTIAYTVLLIAATVIQFAITNLGPLRQKHVVTTSTSLGIKNDNPGKQSLSAVDITR